MTRPPEPDHDDMAEGLKAAFGAEPDPLERPSVLRRLRKKTGSKLDLHLHDRDEASDVPVKIGDDAKSMREPTGRYQVLGEIGRGGVGVVFKGRDLDLGRDVAIKALRPEHVNRPEIVERFVEEAQIGGQLQHPGIVPVYEIGLQAGERPYFAMKLVKGDTLATLLAQRKAPDEDRRRFLGIFEQVCQTIAYAHARRVVHRDIKPHNVMLGSFGEVQVVDWGFAKVLPLASAEVSSTPKPASIASVIATVRSDPKKGSHSVVGSMMGTPAYMPPEQALGDVEHMDQRSDVFGLGAMLCEILTGAPPYLAADGDLIHQAARADLQGAYGRLERCGADAVLIALCKQCLSPSRQARPDSAKQVAESVAQFLTSVEDRARQAQIHAAEAKVRARSTLLLSAAAVLLLSLGGGGYLFLQHEKQTRRDQANERVASALNEANVRFGEARTKDPPDLALWTRAADAAAQAGSLAGEADVSSDERARVAQLQTSVHDEQAAAIANADRIARDAAMQQRLLEVRIQRLDEQRNDYIDAEMRRRSTAYADAFSAYLGGRDVTTMSTEEAVHALSGAINVDLASGLDSWWLSRNYLAVRETSAPPDPAITARLRDLASAIDPDPWRIRMRAALAPPVRDRAAIVALRRDVDLDSLPAMSMLMLGAALVDVGEGAAAQAVNEHAVERFPTNFACVYDLALLHQNAERFAQAEPWWRVAHSLRPDMNYATCKRAIALAGLGRHREEEQLFRQLAAEQPDEPQWVFRVGFALQAQGRFDEAIAWHQRAIAMGRKEWYYYTNLAICYGNQGRLDDSVAANRKAMEVDPRAATPPMNLGNDLADQGKLDESAAALRHAIELDPNYASAHYNLALTLRAQRKLEESVASQRRGIELDPKNAEGHDALSIVLIDMGRFDEAVASSRRAVELDPKTGRYHYDLANALARQGKIDEAIAAFRRAIELDPKDARFHNNLANLLKKKGELEEALASYRRAAAIWSGKRDDYSVRWYQDATRSIADLEPQVQRRSRLLAVLRGESDSKDAAELFDAAMLGYQRGDDQLAVRACELAIDLDPKTANYHFNRGVGLQRLGRLDDAAASYERAIELDGSAAIFHVGLGNVLMMKGDVEDAVDSFRQALELEPKNGATWVSLGKALCQQGEADEAIDCAKKAVELAPGQSGPFFEIGVALGNAGKSDESLACFRKAVELNPKDGAAHHNIGVHLVRSNRLDEALASYRKAVEFLPNQIQFRNDLSLLLERLGQDDAAFESWQKQIEIDPDNAMVHYKLGWHLKQKRRTDEAIARYRRAIELDPTFAEAWCNLSSCLEDAGKFAEALPIVRRGHELGSKLAVWTYPSGEWVRMAAKRAALETNLPDYVAGKIAPHDVDERLEIAQMLLAKRLHCAAVRWYIDLFAEKPEIADDLSKPDRYAAALGAARAAAGLGVDSSRLDGAERAKLRKQALEWLEADLALHQKKLASEKADERAASRVALLEWQNENDLSAIRDARALNSLAPEERDAFTRLWAEVAELLKGR